MVEVGGQNSFWIGFSREWGKGVGDLGKREEQTKPRVLVSALVQTLHICLGEYKWHLNVVLCTNLDARVFLVFFLTVI